MSTRPALRTLLAMIFAASAMSYRMPDSCPVACGCCRSCSMMKRSIVTTDVAVWWITAEESSRGGLGRALEALRRVGSGVSLESVAVVSMKKAFQHVQQGESRVGLKLMDVPELVQE